MIEYDWLTLLGATGSVFSIISAVAAGFAAWQVRYLRRIMTFNLRNPEIEKDLTDLNNQLLTILESEDLSDRDAIVCCRRMFNKVERLQRSSPNSLNKHFAEATRSLSTTMRPEGGVGRQVFSDQLWRAHTDVLVLLEELKTERLDQRAVAKHV